MICFTDETRLTKTDKMQQVIEFTDKIFASYYENTDPEGLDMAITDLEEEWLKIKNS